MLWNFVVVLLLIENVLVLFWVSDVKLEVSDNLFVRIGFVKIKL